MSIKRKNRFCTIKNNILFLDIIFKSKKGIGKNNDANISGFVTTNDISVADLPDQFLEAVHSTREELQAQVDKGEIVFKRVPNEYFQGLEVLDRTS